MTSLAVGEGTRQFGERGVREREGGYPGLPLMPCMRESKDQRMVLLFPHLTYRPTRMAWRLRGAFPRIAREGFRLHASPPGMRASRDGRA